MSHVGLSSRSLSPVEGEVFAAHIADLSVAGLPLAPGLRAAAEESSGRLARALRAAADDLERGVPLEEAFASSRCRLPSHVRGLLIASARTGDVGAALAELIELRQRGRELSRKVLASLIYPAIVLAATVVTFVFLQIVVLRPFLEIVEEFELELPVTVRLSMWWNSDGAWMVAATAVILPLILLVARLALGAARWRRLVSSAPLFGPLWHWSGVAEVTRLLAVLLERELPLPEALRMAAEGTSDANLRQACREMAIGAAEGRPLADLIEQSPRLPAALVPLVAWGERVGELPSALRSASDHFIDRVEMRASLLRLVLPPFAFLLIGAMVLMFFNTVVAPMVALIQGLA